MRTLHQHASRGHPPHSPPLCRYLTVMIWMKLAFSESACAYKEWRGGRGRGGKGRRRERRRFLPCGRFKGGGRREGGPSPPSLSLSGSPFPFPFQFHIGTFEHAHAFRCLNVSFAFEWLVENLLMPGTLSWSKGLHPRRLVDGDSSSGTLNCARHETESTSLAALRPVCQWKGCMILGKWGGPFEVLGLRVD